MKKYTAFLLLMTFLSPLLFSQDKTILVSSPDKKIVLSCQIKPTAPIYTISFNGQRLIDASELSLDFKDSGHFGKNLRLKKVQIKEKDEQYALIVGKAKNVRNHYQEAKMELVETQSPFRTINLFARVYDDAVAFRYDIPKQKNWTRFELMDENSTFNFAQNPMVYTLFRPNYLTSHEGLYTKIPLDNIKNDTLMDMPTLFELKNAYVSITEAALLDYAGMYLSKTGERKLVSKLSPLPNQMTIKVVASLPHRSPWRVIMVGEKSVL